MYLIWPCSWSGKRQSENICVGMPKPSCSLRLPTYVSNMLATLRSMLCWRFCSSRRWKRLISLNLPSTPSGSSLHSCMPRCLGRVMTRRSSRTPGSSGFFWVWSRWRPERRRSQLPLVSRWHGLHACMLIISMHLHHLDCTEDACNLP